jgi:hypothetical protein
MFRSIPAHLATSQTERLVLVDFGVAKALATSGTTTIATGTPHYMAPEQSEGRADHRSDLYSAGVILYQLLAGRVPYPADSIGALIRAQSAANFPAIRTIRGDVTEELDAAIRRCLSADPGARFQDADAWLAALDDAASAAGAPAAPAIDPSATLGPEELARLRASGQIPAAGAAGAGAAAAAAAAAAVPGPPGGPPSGPPSGPAGPPPGPPPGPPRTGPPPGGPPPRKKSPVALAGLIAFALVAAVIGAALALGGGDKADGPAKEVFLQPISSIGIDPFKDVAPETKDTDSPDGRKFGEILANLKLPDVIFPKGGGGGSNKVPAIQGSAPGLYGGTNLLSVCDAKKLVQFLQENADKAKAWADALDIDVEDIADYVEGLTDVVLKADLRVINHGFRNGVANAIDSILQAGTAVLVDKFGTPVVRCKCGNPLKPARPLASDVKVTGEAWPNFTLENTVTITPGPEVKEFVLTDVVTDAPVFRIPGAPASATTATPQILLPPSSSSDLSDFSSDSSSSSSTDSSSPPAIDNITQIGATAASSTFSGEFPASLAVDGDTSTSWFSSGGGSAEYTWQAPSSVFIDQINITGNAGNENPDFRTGFGYESVDVVVVDSGGNEVFRETHSLAGTPDPDVTVSPHVKGLAVVLQFSGGEASNCGGFAELEIIGG